MATVAIPQGTLEKIPKELPTKRRMVNYGYGGMAEAGDLYIDPARLPSNAYVGLPNGEYRIPVDIPELPKTDARGLPLPQFYAFYGTDGKLKYIQPLERYWATSGQGDNDIHVQPAFGPTGELLGMNENTNAAAGGTSFFSQLGQIAKETAPIWTAALGANLFTGANLLGGGAGAISTPVAAQTALTGADLGLLSGAGGTTGVTGATLMGSALPAGAGAGGTAALTSGSAITAATDLATQIATQGASPSLLQKAADFLGIKPETLGTLGSSAVQGLLNAYAGSKTAEQAQQAAQTQADATVRAAQIAADAAKFRPVGVTTRFGTSNFGYDAQGNLTTAGYTPSAEITGYQDRLRTLANQGLTEAEQAQTAYQPLTGAASSLFNLGQGYLAKSPEQAAQDYIAKQTALLAPSRQTQLAELQNKLFQQGRTGAAVAQGGNLMATSPELAAYYNALAQSDLTLAANAEQAAQERIKFGAGLFDTGAGLQGKYYSGQTAAFAPFTTAMDTTTGLENLAQVPLTLGTQIGAKTTASAAEAGRLTGAGITGAANVMAPVNAFSPTGQALSAFGSSPEFKNALNNAFGVPKSTAPKYQIINGQLVQVA